MTACPIQRVLVVSFSTVPASDRQGVEIETVIKALAPRFQVDVLTVRSSEMGYVERYRQTRMLRVPVGGGSREEQVDAFRRAVKRQLEGAEYDLIHFRSAYGGVAVCQLRGYLDCKLVYELGITSSSEVGREPPGGLEALRADEEYCLSHADLVIAPTALAARTAQAMGATCPVALVPPGVDIDTFDWEPTVPQPIHRIAFVGRLAPSRGLLTLLEALAITQRYMESHLVLVGPLAEGFGKTLEEACRLRGLTGYVHLIGEVDHDEVPRILAMADVCVCPWAPDLSTPLASAPLKLLEYLSCRRPVVTVDQPVVRELFGDQAAVKMVPPSAPGAMASALLQLLSEPHRAEAMAETGYLHVRAQYAASTARRALLTAYGRVVPVGANLWGHASVVQPVTGSSTQSRFLGGCFRDTTHDNRRFLGTVTPTGETLPPKGSSAQEAWVMLRPDTSSDFIRSEPHGEGTTDPEFVAAGALLTGSGGYDDLANTGAADTSPQASYPSTPSTLGPPER